MLFPTGTFGCVESDRAFASPLLKRGEFGLVVPKMAHLRNRDLVAPGCLAVIVQGSTVASSSGSIWSTCLPVFQAVRSSRQAKSRNDSLKIHNDKYPSMYSFCDGKCSSITDEAIVIFKTHLQAGWFVGVEMQIPAESNQVGPSPAEIKRLELNENMHEHKDE